MVALTDGERWARAELERLLERRFSPAAVAGFLAASFRRSAHVRRSRPELARQSRRWMAIGAAAWLLPPFRARARAGLAWWALTSLMLDWHLGMIETTDGRPRPLSGADALTLARLARPRRRPRADARRHRRRRAQRRRRRCAGAAGRADARRARPRGPRRRLLRRRRPAGRLRRGAVAPAAVGAELARLGAGFGYALVIYFGRADAPDPRVTRAARPATPVRAAGLVAAGLGRRRPASALLAAGSAWSIGSLVYGVRRG
ncbi:MAG: hypothetical protein ACJ76K_04135 [Solirubrobacteraceae bacterium]